MNNTEQERRDSPDDQAGADPDGAHSDAKAPPVTGTRSDRPKVLPVTSVGQLLLAIYNGWFKRASLKKAELAAMRTASLPSNAEREEMLALAKSDRTLERTRRLMLIGSKHPGPIISTQIREFARDVLQHHPAFQAESLAGVLANLPEAASEDVAVTYLAGQDFVLLPWPDGNRPARKGDYEQCRINAVQCLLLLFWATRGTPVERIQRHLQATLWAPTARRVKSDADKVFALITTRDPVAAAISIGFLDKNVVVLSQRAEGARKDGERAAARASNLELELDVMRQNLTEERAKLEKLSLELNHARKSHETAKVRLKDDYEELRGRVLHRLKDELLLLDEGLHALRRDPPKVHVMVDHAERAIDGLRREMERLLGSNGR